METVGLGWKALFLPPIPIGIAILHDFGATMISRDREALPAS